MNTTAQNLSQKSLSWLKQDVFPLWMKNGIDLESGSFVEALSMEGEALSSSRRALVQSRQIYSFVTAAKIEIIERGLAEKIVYAGIESFTKNYIQESGACIHSVDIKGSPDNTDLDLYTQAFALFAYANAFEITHHQKYKDQALKLLDYLRTHRKALGGGYTEIKGGKTFYQSNPHMHLFEAALAWATVDSATEWEELSSELYHLCMNKFIDAETGNLCEHFDEGWKPQRVDGNFIFEPGHHFEWAWLLSIYQDFFHTNTKDACLSLYEKATHYGVNDKHFVVDEVWSNGVVKKSSSRFWPQCERIKAACRLGSDFQTINKNLFATHADQGLEVLFSYFQTPIKGLWQDVLLENGEFSKQDPKGSSLYHIINALDEYLNLRPKLFEG
jgi:mannose/cellobiose epimerase-like protein (N-acyl-D-glucosamine 2-epimerase family)